MAGSELYGSGTVPKKGDTIRMLMVKEVLSGPGGGGGGTGNGQTVSYSGTDANTAGVKPANVNADAIAYSIDGSGPIMGWNKNTQIWT